jgi:hypothetical protein
MPRGKQDWAFVAQVNRKEFDTKVTWLLEKQPQHPEARAVAAVLAKPPLVPDAIPKHMLPEGAILPSTAPSTADGMPSWPRQHRHRKHREGCARHARRVEERSAQRERVQGAVLADAAKEMLRGNFDVAASLRSVYDRQVASAEIGVHQALSPPREKKPAITRKERQLKALLAEDAPTLILPQLYVPGVVGKGMALFLTGNFTADPHQYDRRPVKEHPDFGKVARQFDAAKEVVLQADTPVPDASRLEHGSPAHHRKLMKLPCDKTFTRKKDEVKAHLELACTTGKTMMR